MFVCLECWQIFDHTLLHDLGEGMPCPIRGCSGEIFDIDENFIAVIKLLNEKGYETRFCCSGHVWDIPGSAYAYIAFQEGIEKKELEPLPNGWRFSDREEGPIIRAEYHDPDSVNIQLAIFSGVKAVATWALKLKARDPEFLVNELE